MCFCNIFILGVTVLLGSWRFVIMLNYGYFKPRAYLFRKSLLYPLFVHKLCFNELNMNFNYQIWNFERKVGVFLKKIKKNYLSFLFRHMIEIDDKIIFCCKLPLFVDRSGSHKMNWTLRRNNHAFDINSWFDPLLPILSGNRVFVPHFWG